MARRVGVLALVLGDQLDPRAPVLDGLDRRRDAVWMAEVEEETSHVWSHKVRIAAFFAAMRHHRERLRDAGWTVHYTALPRRPRDDRGERFGEVLALDVRALRPERLRRTRCGRGTRTSSTRASRSR